METDCITLNNGVKMPRIGFGTYQMPTHITARCVGEALEAGYRHIDTAQCYGNEADVGKAVRSSRIARTEIFVTTKLWACHGYGDTLRSIDGSLSRLDIGAIDLLLMHEPMGDFCEVYRAMETALREGKVRAIGVSNFLEENYQNLVSRCSVIPAVNQVETHVFRQQKTLRTIENSCGTAAESWSPLACGKNGIFKNPVLSSVAKKHGKTAAQVALHFLYQQNVIVIPKTTSAERMKENLSITDFALDGDDMAAIERLDGGKSLFGWW